MRLNSLPLTLLLFLGLASGSLPGQWLERPGEGWLELKVFYQNTNQQFDTEACRATMPEDAEALTVSSYLNAALGIVQGLDVWTQLPFHHIEFNDFAGDRQSSGLGEVRFFARFGPELFQVATIPLAVRAGVKLPRELKVDAEIISLGEGQRDWELILELGHSFYPAPVYLSGLLGRRWREENTTTGFKPGDELFFMARASGDLDAFSWKVDLEGMDGSAPETFGLRILTAQREFLTVHPQLAYRAGPGKIEGGVRLPLAGRNFTAGPIVSLGYFVRWKDF